MTTTFEMMLYHGRLNPDQDMEDWGFHGPVIKGITSMTYTYGNYTVWFSDSQTARQAQALTGWSGGIDDSESLEVPYMDDMIRCLYRNVAGEIQEAYFGDSCFRPCQD